MGTFKERFFQSVHSQKRELQDHEESVRDKRCYGLEMTANSLWLHFQLWESEAVEIAVEPQ